MPPLITIWRIPLEASDKLLAESHTLLSAEESHKAAQFKSDIHRRRYTVRHAAMRQILSREVKCKPDELHFVQGPFGKPSLQYPFGQVQFNLSHSADMALLAVSTQVAMGVDIEAQRPLADLDGLVNQVCNSAEEQLVMNSVDAEQLFFRCWAGKEAVLKCLGLGLSAAMKEFGVLDTQGQLIRSPILPTNWSGNGSVELYLLDNLPEGFAGAVSVLHKRKEQRSEVEIRMQDWHPDH
jgi:4'-phosphopantetheinyl transferase